MKNEDKPAFVHQDSYEKGFPGNGLTKREYFVGQILAGDIDGMAGSPDPKQCAKWAIMLADEVMKQLEETENTES